MSTLSATRITTDRLVLRKAHEADRAGFIDLQTDPEVRAYLGGPKPRATVEANLDRIGNVADLPGVFVVADKATDEVLGTLILKPRSTEAPGRVTDDGGELELSYLFRRRAWGAGFAFEAATAALRSAAEELDDQPVVIVTQTANERSLKLAARLGFRLVETFEQFGAEQSLYLAELHSFSGGTAAPRSE